jgi:hypothetical protein
MQALSASHYNPIQRPKTHVHGITRKDRRPTMQSDDYTRIRERLPGIGRPRFVEACHRGSCLHQLLPHPERGWIGAPTMIIQLNDVFSSNFFLLCLYCSLLYRHGRLIF